MFVLVCFTVSFVADARKLQEVGKEEIALKAEKLLLERKLAREKERSNALNKQLSESESSLEIDDERLLQSVAREILPKILCLEA